MDERITTLAHNLVSYSCQVKTGDKVYVHYIGESTKDLAKELVRKIYEAGGVPFVHYTDPQLQRAQLMRMQRSLKKRQRMRRLSGKRRTITLKPKRSRQAKHTEI